MNVSNLKERMSKNIINCILLALKSENPHKNRRCYFNPPERLLPRGCSIKTEEGGNPLVHALYIIYINSSYSQVNSFSLLVSSDSALSSLVYSPWDQFSV